MSLVIAWIPYLLIGLALVITRVWSTLQPDSWAGAMKAFKVTLPFFGGASRSWAGLWYPGSIFISVGLSTMPLHGMNGDTVKEAW